MKVGQRHVAPFPNRLSNLIEVVSSSTILFPGIVRYPSIAPPIHGVPTGVSSDSSLTLAPVSAAMPPELPMPVQLLRPFHY